MTFPDLGGGSRHLFLCTVLGAFPVGDSVRMQTGLRFLAVPGAMKPWCVCVCVASWCGRLAHDEVHSCLGASVKDN